MTSNDTSTTYDLESTRITSAGVVRCCLLDVATEYLGKRVKLGDKSQCPHCNTTFTLVAQTPYPVWKPDWQIENDTKEQQRRADQPITLEC